MLNYFLCSVLAFGISVFDARASEEAPVKKPESAHGASSEGENPAAAHGGSEVSTEGAKDAKGVKGAKDSNKDKESKETKDQPKKIRELKKSKVNWGNATCLSDPSVFADLKKSKIELAQKKRKLTEWEAELSKREALIKEELEKIQVARKDLKGDQDSKNAKSQEKLAKVVETLLGMSPKMGAKMLEGLDEDLAVKAMSEMDSNKLAKVMNLMKPERAMRLSERLAGMTKGSGK